MADQVGRPGKQIEVEFCAVILLLLTTLVIEPLAGRRTTSELPWVPLVIYCNKKRSALVQTEKSVNCIVGDLKELI